MKFAFAFSAFIATLLAAAPNWITLDRQGEKLTYLHRQADPSSLRRQGTWALFTQRWMPVNNGQPNMNGVITEKMAVNCLTGAWGTTRYPTKDPASGATTFVEQPLQDVEDGQSDSTRLDYDTQYERQGMPLYANVRKFACDCPGRTKAAPPSEEQIRKLYAQYCEAQKRFEVHSHFLRFDTEEEALSAVRELEAGASFEAIFDRTASDTDKSATPHGDLGFHPESDWPLKDRRILRALQPGEFTHKPQKRLFGWELEKLDERRELPSPSLESVLPRIREYASRARACGWPE